MRGQVSHNHRHRGEAGCVEVLGEGLQRLPARPLETGRRARSSTGYPVSIISGKATRVAPAAAAFAVVSTTSARLPSRSPTVGLTCASAILICAMGSVWQTRVSGVAR